jgi:hypothetical protein
MYLYYIRRKAKLKGNPANRVEFGSGTASHLAIPRDLPDCPEFSL